MACSLFSHHMQGTRLCEEWETPIYIWGSSQGHLTRERERSLAFPLPSFPSKTWSVRNSRESDWVTFDICRGHVSVNKTRRGMREEEREERYREMWGSISRSFLCRFGIMIWVCLFSSFNEHAAYELISSLVHTLLLYVFSYSDSSLSGLTLILMPYFFWNSLVGRKESQNNYRRIK